MLPSASAIIYYIASELLIIYYHRIFKSLELLLKIDDESNAKQVNFDSSFERVVILAKSCFTLNQTSHFLQSKMGLILLVNCVFVFINSFMNLFYVIWRLQQGWVGYFDASGINLANFIETCGRFFLFCHATDRLNSTVRVLTTNCIVVIKKYPSFITLHTLVI